MSKSDKKKTLSQYVCSVSLSNAFFCVFLQLEILIVYVNMIVMMAPISPAGQNAENDAFKKSTI